MKKLARKGNMNERIDTVLQKFRSRMTSYPPGMCPLALYRSLLQISMNQSCGKCVPCRDGLAEVYRMLSLILNGGGDRKTMTEMESMCRMIARTADCAVGVVGANLVLDSLAEFADEYESHISEHRCVENVAQTIPCVTLCPAHVDVPGYIALVRAGDYEGAVKKIREKNPFPTASEVPKKDHRRRDQHPRTEEIRGGAGAGRPGRYPEAERRNRKARRGGRRRAGRDDRGVLPGADGAPCGHL